MERIVLNCIDLHARGDCSFFCARKYLVCFVIFFCEESLGKILISQMNKCKCFAQRLYIKDGRLKLHYQIRIYSNCVSAIYGVRGF